MRVVAMLLMLSPAAAQAQQVFKCDGPSGSVYQNTPCETGAKPHQLARDSSFGESKRSGEIAVEGFVCKLGQSISYANGFLVNRTPEPKQVELTATFTTLGSVQDTTTQSFNVPQFGRTPFSLVGSIGGRCELSWRWD